MELTTSRVHPSYTTLELHTPSTLLNSSHLPALFSLINYAFDLAHQKDGRSLLPPSDLARLKTHNQLGEEVGADGFVLIMLQQHEPQDSSSDSSAGFRSPGGQRIIGTASAKPYTLANPADEPGDAIHHLFKRLPDSKTSTTGHDDELPRWEILAMVVDPTLQGQGLATQLMNLRIDEIKRRCGSGLRQVDSVIPHPPPLFSDLSVEAVRDANDVPVQEKRKSVSLLLSTMKDLNEGYYARRGWTATATRCFPKGTMGSRDGFRVVEMFRRVRL